MARSKVNIKLDHAGIGQVLRSQGAMVAAAAAEVAVNARGMHPEAKSVDVATETTDRSRATVTIKDPRAKLWQVKDGVLTRAAAAAGLELGDR